MTDIPEDIRAVAQAAFMRAIGMPSHEARCDAVAKALLAERERCAKLAKYVGETFLLDMTAKPEWQDDGTWGRIQAVESIVAAIRTPSTGEER